MIRIWYDMDLRLGIEASTWCLLKQTKKMPSQKEQKINRTTANANIETTSHTKNRYLETSIIMWHCTTPITLAERNAKKRKRDEKEPKYMVNMPVAIDIPSLWYGTRHSHRWVGIPLLADSMGGMCECLRDEIGCENKSGLNIRGCSGTYLHHRDLLHLELCEEKFVIKVEKKEAVEEIEAAEDLESATGVDRWPECAWRMHGSAFPHHILTFPCRH